MLIYYVYMKNMGAIINDNGITATSLEWIPFFSLVSAWNQFIRTDRYGLNQESALGIEWRHKTNTIWDILSDDLQRSGGESPLFLIRIRAVEDLDPAVISVGFRL